MGERAFRWLLLVSVVMTLVGPSRVMAEPLVILTSPRLEKPLVALAESFEAMHSDVHIKILLDSGLGLRGTISRLQNAGMYGIESGVVHIVAPADQQLLDRLEYRYYVLQGTRRPYATTRLVLVAQADGQGPIESLDDLRRNTTVRVVVADPEISELGHRTKSALDQLRWSDAVTDHIIISHDVRGVLDRIIHRKADTGILFEYQAVAAGPSLKIIAPLPEDAAPPVVYAMAMERFCPNRQLCQAFLDFSQSPEARTILAGLGYGVPDESNSLGTETEPVGSNKTEASETHDSAPHSSWWVRFLDLFRREGTSAPSPTR